MEQKVKAQLEIALNELYNLKVEAENSGLKVDIHLPNNHDLNKTPSVKVYKEII